jgi:predicted CXXCH cytochrome family protein
MHAPDVLSECGLCHNAHGSTVKANLVYPKQTACKLCHD